VSPYMLLRCFHQRRSGLAGDDEDMPECLERLERLRKIAHVEQKSLVGFDGMGIVVCW
jgi:hypothetical protein